MRARPTLLLASFLLAGCGETAPLTAPEVGLAGSFEWADDRYPTEHEFLTYGGTPNLNASTPTASFSGTEFRAESRVDFSWVNTANALLRAWLIDDTGAQLNSGETRFDRVLYRPFSLSETLQASASTLNKQCGLTGKSSVSADAEINVIRLGELASYVFWSDRISRNGRDVDQGACHEFEDRVEPANGRGGGGSGCVECLEEPPMSPTWCMVRYWYDKQTGEIVSWTVLACW